MSGKTACALYAILIAIALGIASKMWPRSAEDKLVETTINDVIQGFSVGDSLRTRSVFSLPEVFTDAKLDELAHLIHANGSVEKSVYLGSQPGKIGDHAVLSSSFLLKFSDKTENLFNVVSDLASWGNSKPFVMNMALSGSAAKTREAFAFLPSENGLRSYFLLLMGIAALVVSTFAVYKALYLRPKYWFVWLVACLIGVLRFRLNWATEDYDLQLTSVAIPVFEMIHTSVLAPYFFTFGVPVGAIAFLNHVKVD